MFHIERKAVIYEFSRNAAIYLIVFLNVCISVALFLLGDFVRAFMSIGMLSCSIFFIHEVVFRKCKEISFERFMLNTIMLLLILHGNLFLLLRGYAMKVFPIILALCLFLLPNLARAGSEVDVFDAPCTRFGVPKDLVLAIAKVESDMQPWVVNVAGKDYRAKSPAQALAIIHEARARGLSHDIGIMQINDWWLRRLGISPETALDPSNNATLGVWILAREIHRHGFNWRAVGYYHSPTPWRQSQYAYKVSKHYQKISRGK